MRPPSRRIVIALLLVTLGLAGPLAAWWLAGSAMLRDQVQGLREKPLRAAHESAQALAGSLWVEMERLRVAEDSRPWYQYQDYFHDPQGAYEGAAVVPSPLMNAPRDPLVAQFFEVGADGGLRLVESRPGAGHAGLAEAGMQALREAPPWRANSASQSLSKSAFYQNVDANRVFEENQQAAARRWSPPAGGPDQVEVETGAFEWRTLRIAGAPEIVALRRVRKPEAEVVQGLLLSRERIASWIAASGDRISRLEPGPATNAWSHALPMPGEPWHVSVNYDWVRDQAESGARSVERSFHLRFVLVAALALACGLGVVGLAWGAERMAAERSQFAASAAHELRTPLAGLKLHAEMLADGLGDPRRSEQYARRMADEAGRLGRVVTNVLGFSRLERGTLSVSVTEGDVGACLRERVESLRAALEHSGARIVVDLSAQPVRADFDPEALGEIVTNLLDNAEKYSRCAADRGIEVSARREERVVRIDVRDHGPGIDRAASARLFRPFARGANCAGPAGLGLGLALSRTLARAMGGDLVHAGAEGGGSRFTLTLPVTRSEVSVRMS